MDLRGDVDDAMSALGRAVPNPSPTDRVRERRTQHDMDPDQRPHRQRLPVDSSVPPEFDVQLVDVGRCQAGDEL